MVNFSLFFILASSLSALASPTIERTVSGLEHNLVKLKIELTALRSDVNAFPIHGGTLKASLEIHEAGVRVAAALSDCSDSVVGVTSVSERDALLVVNLVDGVVPLIVEILDDIVARKIAFLHLALGGAARLVKKDLQTLDIAAVHLGGRLIDICPPHIKPRAIKIKGEIDIAFNRANAAYANV